MLALSRPFGRLHVRVDGPADAPAVVFANSLGTDLRLWDAVLPLLPQNLRHIRYDKRGHGLSDLGGGDVITDHADDAIAVITEVARGPVVFVGLSIGGMIAQVVAQQRPDLLRAVILSNTCAKLGTAQSWQDRIALIERDGLAALGPAVMERWFAPAFRATPACALWQNMLIRTPEAGYIAACHALAQADQRDATAKMRLPALVIAGSEDGATPPEQVRDTANLIHGAAFHVIDGAGHLPCTEAPVQWAALVAPFLQTYAGT